MATRGDGGARRSDWSPGLVTEMVLVMVQLKVVDPVKPALSVTVMVTG